MEVRVTKAKIVKPAQDRAKVQLWTSIADHVVPQLHVPTLYLYPYPSHSSSSTSQPYYQGGSHGHAIANNSSFFNWEVLEAALAQVLVEYYPLAGRLMRAESDGRIGIECNGEGVVLLDAVAAHATIADLGDFRNLSDSVPTHSLQGLAPHVAYSEDIGSSPLLLLQVTRFQCGGVSLGVQIHHHVVDGMSGMHFINTWAELARHNLNSGMGYCIPKPFLDRTLLKARFPPSPRYPHIEYQSPPLLMEPDGKESTIENGPIVSAIFRLSPEQLTTLKSLAISGNSSYTTYEALSSHVWRCVSRARELQPIQQTKLNMAINARSRMHPPLPDGYFGNAIFTSSTISSVDDLTLHPLSYGADLIHDALVRMDNDYIHSSIEYLELQPSLKKLVHGIQTFGSPNLGIISWVHLPMYDADFGWGRPIFMGPVCRLLEGLVFIFPSPCGDGSLYVSLGLFSNHMNSFNHLFYQI